MTSPSSYGNDGFRNMLANLTSPHDTQRQEAEQFFTSAAQSPQMLIPRLVEEGLTSTDETIGRMSLVLLRQQFKKTHNPWKQLDQNTQSQVKQRLLEGLASVNSKPQGHALSHAIAELVSAIACEGKAWDEVLGQITTLLRDAQENRREIAAFLLCKIAEYAGEEVLVPHAKELWPTIHNLLSDSCVQVTSRGIQAICYLILSMDGTSQRQCSQLIQPILESFQRVITNDEEAARDSLEAIVEIAKQAAFLFDDNLNSIQEGMIYIATQSTFEPSTRQIALEVIIQLCEEGGTMIRKNKKFVENIVVTSTNLIAEVDDDDEWQSTPENTKTFTGDSEDDEMAQLGEEALDRVVNGVGAKTCLPFFLNHVGTLFSGDWQKRRAALVGLSLVGPAATKEMYSQLRMITEKVVSFFQDPHPRVRNAAVYCIRELSLAFSDTGKKKSFQQMTHDLVVPNLNLMLSENGLSGGIERLRSAAAAAYTGFLTPHACKPRHLGNIRELLELLVNLLNQSYFIASKEHAMTAIAAASSIAKKEFSEFYDNFMSIAKQVFEKAVEACQADGSSVSLKNRALECIALICSSVGGDKARKDAHQVMQILVNNPNLFETDDSESYQYMTAACVRLGKTLGDEVAPYLSVLLPPLKETAMMDIPLTVVDPEETQEDERFAHVPVQVAGEGSRIVAVDSSKLQDKCTAASMLFHYVESLSSDAVLPYLDLIAEPLLKGISESQIQNLRVTCLCSASPLLRCALNDSKDHTRAQRYASDIIGRLCASITAEEDREVVATAAEVIAECVRLCKDSHDASFPSTAAPQENEWERLLVSIKQAMQKSKEEIEKAGRNRKQEEFDEEAAAQLDESLSNEEEILTSLVDCVGFLIKLHRERLLPYVSKVILPEILPWLDRTQQHEAVLLSSALCCCEDIIEYCGEQCGELVGTILPRCLSAIDHRRGSVKQSAAYGIGIIAKGMPQYMQKDVTLNALSKLSQLVKSTESTRGEDEEMEAAVDNAVAAIFKISWYRMPYLGLESEIPHLLELVLGYLPITQDTIEGREIHEWLMESIKNKNNLLFSVANSNVGNLVQILGSIAQRHYEKLTEEIEEDEERDYVIKPGSEKLLTESLQVLRQMDSNQFQQVYNSFDITHKSAIEELSKM